MNIFISNLSFDVQDKELSNFFSPYGEVASAKVIVDKTTSRSRGFGFVEMPDDEASKKAIGFCSESFDVIKNFTPFMFFIRLNSNTLGSLLTVISFLNLSIKVYIFLNEQRTRKPSDKAGLSKTFSIYFYYNCYRCYNCGRRHFDTRTFLFAWLLLL